MHRHRPQPTPGQLSLKLKLPKVRRSRQQKQNWQLTLADLIDRLPRLSLELHQQLELDLSNRNTLIITEVDRAIDRNSPIDRPLNTCGTTLSHT
jgi:hypothetical protein